jgi:hypothetical protein
MRVLLLLALAASSLGAHAAVYRCEVQGRPVYTDKPCAPGAQPHAMAPIGAVPAAPASDLAAAHEARRERQLERRERADEAWLEAHAERRKRDATMGAAAARGKVLKDMSADEVRRALGGPDQVSREDGREEWTYGSGKQRRTVVLEGGKVVRAPASGARRTRD